MDPRSPERGQYAFVQALIREVAYNTLSKKDRKKLHLAAARYFESLGSDELAGALASHYLAAHANAGEGAEADALAGQARIALEGRGRASRGAGQPRPGAEFYEQALAVTTDPSERVELLLQAAEKRASRAVRAGRGCCAKPSSWRADWRRPTPLEGDCAPGLVVVADVPIRERRSRYSCRRSPK